MTSDRRHAPRARRAHHPYFSEEKAREFYVDFLGFSVDWEHRFGDNFPLYAQVRRSDLVLHLSEHHGDATPGSTIFVPVRDIDALHRELQAKNYKYAKPGVEALPWGKVLEVADPFGNRLRFCEVQEEGETRQ
ncbi:MAG: Glyoxalase family protein [uncultured Paraburkholderia sp.]|nr:MAG: Glyoxalase family protein [uncultured Paraburkholderia sp.]CAH2804816.1 MAG: Glyoxalase family protein [uncultured Paraburkholderia sp.]CAH2940079.1 MAG: Glyoxalase family protein [uncultured Paraburkholderia sp.]CAH2941763.1 MAG: Glyoxalase family protein [uncultured Paraburkholderia sp.]